MVYRSFSFIPLMNDNLISDRFSQIDKLFSRITGEKPISDLPHYNLYKHNKENLKLEISVPGYKENELEISVLNSKLTISGKNKNENVEVIKNNEKKTWLHKGIEKKDFSMNFNLDHRIKITHADLTDGILKISFKFEIPEEEKPQKITITQKSQDKILMNKNT